MANRPLLLFPAPESVDRTKRRSFPGRIHRPTHTRQGERLSPLFAQLQIAFNERCVEVQPTTAGIDPEQALVIETIGNIENFANAVKRIDGLEWMGEIEADEIAPDTDFYDEDKPEKELTGRLYLVMTNQEALNQMLSLWSRYQADPEMKFQRGLTKFRDVFLCLKDIRRWGVQDRLNETGVLDVWREDLAYDSNQVVRVEVELWFRGSEGKRQAAQQYVAELINQLGGQVTGQCVIHEITYHSLLAEVPTNAAQQIIDHPDVDLIKCDSIMFFRPVGQMATDKKPVEGDLTDFESEERPLPTGDPIIAVLDGMPLANHNLLVDRLIIDDPDDYASQYRVADRVHGSSMSSLVVHGDLSCNEQPLARPVYVRPIMKPRQWPSSPRPETIPEDVLVVDLIHRAVRRMFDGDGTGDAEAPSIRVINLSIADPCRQFSQVMSPLARLLDWLSVKYGALFVVSVGNASNEIETDMSGNDFSSLSDNEREEMIVKKLYENMRHRKLLSPAESINGITVGSVHVDSATIPHPGHLLNLYENVLPSPVSSFGSGYRRAVKPDLIFSGGRLLFEKPVGTTENAVLKARHFLGAPGNKVASPSSVAGDLNKTAYNCGTSNSTALISRAAGICYDSLVDIFEDQAPDLEYEPFMVPLLKAMVVHGCSWDEIGSRLQTILETPDNRRQLKKWITQWLGYGVPDVTKVLDCTEQRASLLGFGQLDDEQAHVFNLPLPMSLGARREWRRLTVTLAWLSPIASSTQRYRTANLWFEVNGGELAPERQNVDHNAVRRGTVQHEVFEGERAVPISNGDALSIKVNCRKDAAKINEPVFYGLVVSLEVAEGVDIAIYEEVRTQIAVPIQIQQSTGDD